MHQASTPFGRTPEYPTQFGVAEYSPQEPDPAPVFVDQSGLRSRLFRRLGWPVSVVGAILAAAMGGSLIGMQSDAPAMEVPPGPAYLPTSGPLPPFWP
ncbi:hypothetical protein GCM10010363_16640 [Streptomyces omiyaensis]|nr:hypothetical protein GCM10010363_16640 [Streptomyces omiyaensis]